MINIKRKTKLRNIILTAKNGNIMPVIIAIIIKTPKNF